MKRFKRTVKKVIHNSTINYRKEAFDNSVTRRSTIDFI